MSGQRPHPAEPLDQVTSGNGTVRVDDRLQVLAGFASRPGEQLVQPGDIRRFGVHAAKYR
jgi:hypothetical protein